MYPGNSVGDHKDGLKEYEEDLVFLKLFQRQVAFSDKLFLWST